MFERLRQLVARFRREDSGNVLMITAFAAPAIGIATIGALDFWQLTEQHRRMTVAGEQAAIAALRPKRTSMRDRRELAERIFLVNTQQGEKLSQTRLAVRSWQRYGETFVQVTADAKYKSIFGPVAGGEPKALRTVTTAARKGARTRIVPQRARRSVSKSSHR